MSWFKNDDWSFEIGTSSARNYNEVANLDSHFIAFSEMKQLYLNHKMITKIVQVKGKYFKGVLTLQQEISSEKPLDVIVVFPEVEQKGEELLNFSQFGFTKAQELLADFKGSFTKTILEERRRSR